MTPLILAALTARAAPAEEMASAQELVAYTTALRRAEGTLLLLGIQGETRAFEDLWADDEVVVREIGPGQIAVKSVRALMGASGATCGVAAVPAGDAYTVRRVGSCAYTDIAWDASSVEDPLASLPPAEVASGGSAAAAPSLEDAQGSVTVREVTVAGFTNLTSITRDESQRSAMTGLASAGVETVGLKGSRYDAEQAEEARFVLVGRVEDLRVRAGTAAAAEVTVRWELTDKEHERVVLIARTRGFATEGGAPRDRLVGKAVEASVSSLTALPALRTALARPNLDDALAMPPPTWEAPLDIQACAAPDAAMPGELSVRMPAIVRVRTPDGGGTGVIVSPDGFALTVNHVVHGTKDGDIEVETESGVVAKAILVRSDQWHDAAVLKLPGSGYPCVPFGPRPPLGSDLLAVGNPLGMKDLAFSVARGIVSGNRSSGDTQLIQTDASLNPGYSGGPLLDTNGRVVGLTSFGIVGEGLSGLGFGVPVDVAFERLGARFADTSSAELDDLRGSAEVPDVKVSLVEDSTPVAPSQMGREATSLERKRRMIWTASGAAQVGAGLVMIGSTFALGSRDEMSVGEWTSLQLLNSVGWVLAVGGAGTLVAGQVIDGTPTLGLRGRL